MKFILFLALSLFLQGALGELICEELPVEMCTLSIASNGKRCVLESRPSSEGKVAVECQTSEVFASNKMLQEYIETDECVSACGVDRQSLGLSSDALLDSKFITKLCSHQCYTNCPNIIDLYSNVASAEGVPLPKMCSSQKIRPRRGMSQLILSSGATAPVAYGGGGSVSDAPAPVGSTGPGSDAAPPIVSGGPGSAAPSPDVNGGNTSPGSDAAPPVVYGGPVSDAPPPEVNGGSTGPGSDAAPPVSSF
ncbi:unnamed protein product [Withania somnifera]